MAKRESWSVNELVTPTGATLTFAAAAPTVGAHKVGDIVINTAPSAGGVFSWSCVTAGTPGTWEATYSASTVLPAMPVGAIAATGATVGDATACASVLNVVSAADGTKGVVLPAAVAGKQVIIKNNAGSALKVYPATGDAINALTAGTAISVAALCPAAFIASDATTWFTLPLLPS